LGRTLGQVPHVSCRSGPSAFVVESSRQAAGVTAFGWLGDWAMGPTLAPGPSSIPSPNLGAGAVDGGRGLSCCEPIHPLEVDQQPCAPEPQTRPPSPMLSGPLPCPKGLVRGSGVKGEASSFWLHRVPISALKTKRHLGAQRCRLMDNGANNIHIHSLGAPSCPPVGPARGPTPSAGTSEAAGGGSLGAAANPASAAGPGPARPLPQQGWPASAWGQCTPGAIA
jgi:hypothetical protein